MWPRGEAWAVQSRADAVLPRGLAGNCLVRIPKPECLNLQLRHKEETRQHFLPAQADEVTTDWASSGEATMLGPLASMQELSLIHI
eukprot:3001499-Amphidinium_carterae.1